MLLILGLGACTQPGKEQMPGSSAGAPDYRLQYAQRFEIHKTKTGYQVRINKPWEGSNHQFEYHLVNRNADAPVARGAIRIPVEKVVCLSTTHLAFIDALGEADKIAGVANPSLVYNPRIRKRIDAGELQYIGNGISLNFEMLLELQPDVVFGFGIAGDGGMPELKRLEALGIPVVLEAQYMETQPLGSAEWIKFFGLFFNTETTADSIFDAITLAYQSIRENVAATVTNRPAVFTGSVWREQWTVPAGNSYMAQLFLDAGADYIWKHEPGEGSLFYNFEVVYEKAWKADFWINPGAYRSLKELAEADQRYTGFKAYQQGNVYNNDKRSTSSGGNDYFESGALRQDLILMDLVHIFHPELLPGYPLYYFRKLE